MPGTVHGLRFFAPTSFHQHYGALTVWVISLGSDPEICFREAMPHEIRAEQAERDAYDEYINNTPSPPDDYYGPFAPERRIR